MMHLFKAPMRSFATSTAFAIYALLFVTSCQHRRLGPDPSALREPKARFVTKHHFFGTREIQRYLLGNGMKILIMEDHSSPTFAAQVWYNVGSRDEIRGLTGLAHLFEHMMFRATKTYPDGKFDQLMESAGVEGMNAFTNRDYTGYIQSLPSSQLDLVLKLESDRMVNLLVDDKALDKEREVVQNERRFRNENSPDGTLFEKLYEYGFPGHAYQWPVIGYAEDLDHAKAKQCMDFYKAHYSPQNATLVLVGDVDPQKAVEKIETYFGSLESNPHGAQAHHSDPRPAALLTKEQNHTLELPLTVEKVMIGYRSPEILSKDVPALELLPYLVGHNRSSRLYKTLVDGGMASQVEAAHISGKDGGFLLIQAAAQKGTSGRALLKQIDKDIQWILNQAPSEQALLTAKAQFKFELFQDLETHYSMARNIGFFETVAGSVTKASDLLVDLEKLTPESVLGVARRYLKASNRVVLIGTPKSRKASKKP